MKRTPEMSDNLIEIRDLSVAFNDQTVVRNLCLDIRPGECLALVGESGSGKSVTAHSILQLLPQTGSRTTGSICYRGQELVGAEARVLRQLRGDRSEEHTSELQSLMRISYAVFCLKKKKHKQHAN